MKFLFKTLFTIIFVITTPYSFSQEIDQSILSQLTPEQIKRAQELYKTEDIEVPFNPNIDESLTNEESVDDTNIFSDQKYGYNFFSSIPTSISAVGDLPLPNEYKISLRDQITVILSGSKNATYDLDVKLNGSILFPELGEISVAGKTFNEVKQILSVLIDKSYIGVQIDVSIKNLSAKKITIVGAVKTPGTYLVNPFSTISNALAYSGGVSEIGTLRNIKLIRNNGDVFKFDLYKLLINGDRSDDLTIEAGDVIVIDPADQFIVLSGEVKRPGIYEIKENEKLDDLINYGLGFTQIANKTNLDLRYLDIELSYIKNITSDNLDFSLKNILSVNVNKYLSKDLANVKVDGAIKESGYYSLNENNTLEELINNLEFINVYPWLAVLEQFDNKNLLKSTILFNLNDPNTYRNIKLLPNSRVFFADINTRDYDIDDVALGKVQEYFLTISHKNNTYQLPVYGNYYVKSFVDLLGLDMNDINSEVIYVSPLNNLVVKKDYNDLKLISRKFQTLKFRSPQDDTISVNLSGSVDYPGIYVLQAGSTLNDLYELINFKEESNSNGIILTREAIRETQLKSIEKSKMDLDRSLALNMLDEDEDKVSIVRALSYEIDPENLGRIAGNFKPNSLSANNLILFDGDTVVVPKKSYTITVLGDVLNPISFEFSDKLKLNNVINQAGGFLDSADKSKVYVIKSNGLIEKPGRSIFTNNLKIEPGDTIIVPTKVRSDNPVMNSLLPLTQILADLSFSAAAIDNLKNN